MKDICKIQSRIDYKDNHKVIYNRKFLEAVHYLHNNHLLNNLQDNSKIIIIRKIEIIITHYFYYLYKIL